MLCPKCGKESEGKWCPHCGTQLEIEENFGLNPYDQTQRLPGVNSDDADNTPSEYSYKENTQRNKYYDPEEDKQGLDSFDPYGDYSGDDDANRKKMIAVISVCAVAVLILVMIIVYAVTDKPSYKGRDIDIPSSSENNEIKELERLGEKYMNVGNYKEAEKIYEQLMDISNDDEAGVIYKILYNYNIAASKLEESDYKTAQKYLDKIPSKYPSYSIADDIEALSDDIARYKLAADIFETVEALMDDGDYDEADAAIQNIDETLLSKDNKAKLDKFKATIEESRQKEEEADLNDGDAIILLKEYKAGYVQAVNSGNIDAASYIYKSSPLYSKIGELVNDYSSKDIKISADSTELSELTRIDSISWYVKSAETETHTDSEGNESKESYSRRYIVKYIEGDYYFTDMN